MAAEAKNPQKILPQAVFGTVAIVTVFYVLSSLALVGMQNYADIDTESGFSVAFSDRNMQWASIVVAAGELITLPIVVLISFLAQPRLQYAMSVDGLLPPVFKELDQYGNLRKSMIITGFVLVLVAIFVPFTYLDDMISAGVLISFNLTNSSLIVIRKQHPSDTNYTLIHVVLYNITAFTASLLYTYVDLTSDWLVLPIIFTLFTCYFMFQIHSECIETHDSDADTQYRVPYMPFTPLIGIFLNYYLITQLSFIGFCMILGYIGVAITYYLYYGLAHSIGNKNYWADILLESSALHSSNNNNGDRVRDRVRDRIRDTSGSGLGMRRIEEEEDEETSLKYENDIHVCASGSNSGINSNISSSSVSSSSRGGQYEMSNTNITNTTNTNSGVYHRNTNTNSSSYETSVTHTPLHQQDFNTTSTNNTNSNSTNVTDIDTSTFGVESDDEPRSNSDSNLL